MVVVYFFGPDGSGKSTLAKKLARRIHKQGYKTKLSWMRGSHTFTSLMAKIFSRFDAFKGSENPYYNIRIPKNFKRFWQFLEFFSALPVIIGSFLIPSLISYQVLADRYTLDLVVWICLTTRDYSFLKRFEAKVLIALSMKINAKFYVTANVEELKRRNEKSWFLKEQLCLYYKLAETVDAHAIDTTNKSVDESVQEVLTVLKGVCPKIEVRND
jgi:thymidylate kinase